VKTTQEIFSGKFALPESKIHKPVIDQQNVSVLSIKNIVQENK
jgi:hypothetical protein